MDEPTKLNGEVEVVLAVQKEPAVDAPTPKPIYTQFLVPGAILLAAILVSSALIWTRGQSSTVGKAGSARIVGNEQPGTSADIKVDGDDHILGNKNAKVTIVEFSDFQCPFCRSFWSGALSQIKKSYIDTGKVKFVYKHFPLDFHPGAKPAAEGSECANDQGKFWEFHDKIFEEQAKQGQGTIQFGKSEVVKWAGALGLNMSQFNQCLDSGKHTKVVSEDTATGLSAGVSGTPTLFINGQRIVGAQPFASFQAVIDGLLNK